MSLEIYVRPCICCLEDFFFLLVMCFLAVHHYDNIPMSQGKKKCAVIQGLKPGLLVCKESHPGLQVGWGEV